ncbi:MAG: N-acetylmuramoyl-L-alanine amidase [Caenibius sp.]
MSMRLRLWLLFLAPVLLVAGLFAFGLTIPVPYFGRDYVIRIELPEAGKKIGLPEIRGPQDASRPLVVIDAGHGGHDPGAIGAGYREKSLTLALALALRERLLADGGIRVAMTRDDDRFLALAERSAIARALGADLFLSVHADSSGDVRGISGATVYTLSDKASDEIAARIAERENGADRINGIELVGQSDDVTAILVDLARRRTQEQSAQFASLITREGEGMLAFHPAPRRSAAFAVLKSADIPAVLFEAGYITDPEEAARLASEEGRDRFAKVLSRAIRIYFARSAAG